MSKNASKVLTMDYSDKKKKIPFEFNTENVVLKFLLSNERILERIRHMEVIQKLNLIIVLVLGLPPIVISRVLICVLNKI